ncbi:LPXTG cell wall anchor domain-containing protein [Acaricomes phytoseiuli]|uniref:LPXTG cell wall anchor domain-containing protein n=1 Tax=Acaricomes phytoseiuli TaxID=291968 RepID=UPI000360A129|nr:LPXTG cell wall anchor domain-containing protein [Acaricomes phytoseiuli]
MTPNSDGTLPATDLPVPAGTPAGEYTVVGTQGSMTAEAPYTVDPGPGPGTNPTASNPTASNPTASNPTASNPTASNPTLVAVPSQVKPGEKATIAGNGWPASVTVTLRLNDPSGAVVGDWAKVQTDANGNVPFTTLTVPLDLPAQTLTVTGMTDDGISAMTPLAVLDAADPGTGGNTAGNSTSGGATNDGATAGSVRGSSTGSSLAATGAETAIPLGLAALALIGGAAALVFSRSRRSKA